MLQDHTKLCTFHSMACILICMKWDFFSGMLQQFLFFSKTMQQLLPLLSFKGLLFLSYSRMDWSLKENHSRINAAGFYRLDTLLVAHQQRQSTEEKAKTNTTATEMFPVCCSIQVIIRKDNTMNTKEAKPRLHDTTGCTTGLTTGCIM